MQRVKWERGPHIYTQWSNWVVSQNNRIICETQNRFLDIDLGETFFFFVGFWKRVATKTRHQFTNAFLMFFFIEFQKHVIAKMRHRFTNALSTFFFVRYHFNEKGKGANGCKKTSFTFIHWFPIHDINDLFYYIGISCKYFEFGI